MKRRDILIGGAWAAAGMALGKSALAREPAPAYMPILEQRMAQGDYSPYYEERELIEPGLLCDQTGALNPAARGWSRRPLLRANLKGHWPRKKRWNFWNWISPRFCFSITIADIDYLYFCAVHLVDFETKERIDSIAIKASAPRNAMPEEVEKSIYFQSANVNAAMDHEGQRIRVKCSYRDVKGRDVAADFVIHKPEGHETLNIVVPWSSERFQMNSKHNTLPTEGGIKVDGRRYVMDPDECHAVQDFGRGMWPYRSYWNWGVATGKQGSDIIGVNMGDKWTTGTGANENGICLNGRLYKIMEDLTWEYDPNDWMKPWRVYSTHTDMLDLVLTPFHPETSVISLGLVRTGGTCSYGHWSGKIRPGGREIEIKNMIGWAEEFSHRW